MCQFRELYVNLEPRLLGLFAKTHHGHDLAHDPSEDNQGHRHPKKRPIRQHHRQGPQGEGQGDDDNGCPCRWSGTMIGMNGMAGFVVILLRGHVAI